MQPQTDARSAGSSAGTQKNITAPACPKRRSRQSSRETSYVAAADVTRAGGLLAMHQGQHRAPSLTARPTLVPQESAQLPSLCLLWAPPVLQPPSIFSSRSPQPARLPVPLTSQALVHPQLSLPLPSPAESHCQGALPVRTRGTQGKSSWLQGDHWPLLLSVPGGHLLFHLCTPGGRMTPIPAGRAPWQAQSTSPAPNASLD